MKEEEVLQEVKVEPEEDRKRDIEEFEESIAEAQQRMQERGVGVPQEVEHPVIDDEIGLDVPQENVGYPLSVAPLIARFPYFAVVYSHWQELIDVSASLKNPYVFKTEGPFD